MFCLLSEYNALNISVFFFFTSPYTILSFNEIFLLGGGKIDRGKPILDFVVALASTIKHFDKKKEQHLTFKSRPNKIK